MINRAAIAATAGLGVIAFLASATAACRLARTRRRAIQVRRRLVPAGFRNRRALRWRGLNGRRREPRRRPRRGSGPVGCPARLRVAHRRSSPPGRDLEFVFPKRRARVRPRIDNRGRGLPGQCRGPHELVAGPDPDHLFLFLHQAREGRVCRHLRHPPRQGLDTAARRDFSDRSRSWTWSRIIRRTCRCRSSACATTTISRIPGRPASPPRTSASSSAKARLGGKGSLYSLRAYGEYRFQGRYGAGIAIDAFNLDLDANKNSFTGSYEYDYWGPQLYLIARF